MNSIGIYITHENREYEGDKESGLKMEINKFIL